MLQSVRPYVIRAGKAWCGACGRRRLCRVEGTRWVCCPDCDAGQQVTTDTGAVTIVAGELLCSSCGANALVARPGDGELECPACDTPPWERDQVGQPTSQQLELLVLGDTRPAAVGKLAPDGTVTPDDVVRQCFYCRQVCWHRAEWQIGRWRHVCTGCGNRLQISRVKATRVNRRRGQR